MGQEAWPPWRAYSASQAWGFADRAPRGLVGCVLALVVSSQHQVRNEVAGQRAVI